MRRLIRFYVAGAALSLVLAGCGGGGTTTAVLPDPTVRFFNAGADNVSLDFFVNDVLKAGGVGYTASSADFVSYPFLTEEEGAYEISINRAGSAEELERDYIVLNRDQHYLFIAYGLADPGTELDKRMLVASFVINRTRPIGNKSRFVIFNSLVRETGVDNTSIDFQSFDPSNPASGDNPQFKTSDVTYAEFDPSKNILEIDSGSKTFQVRQNGSDSTLVYAQATNTFEPGKIYLALVSGKVDSVDPALRPKLQFIELSPEN